MTGFLWALLGVLAALAMTAAADMVSEEVRDRLDHLPHAILRLAARRLGPQQRVSFYEDVWLPDLTYLLKGDESRPVTRLCRGTCFALSILASADRGSACGTTTPESGAGPSRHYKAMREPVRRLPGSDRAVVVDPRSAWANFD
jgi:hypothetical protein